MSIFENLLLLIFILNVIIYMNRKKLFKDLYILTKYK
jgi:hypothetical protein